MYLWLFFILASSMSVNFILVSIFMNWKFHFNPFFAVISSGADIAKNLENKHMLKSHFINEKCGFC